MMADGSSLSVFAKRRAQRIDALRMGPYRQMAVRDMRQPAGRRDRGVGEIAACIGRLEALPALRIAGVGRAEDTVDRRPLQQPAGLLLGRGRRLDVLPFHMIDRGGTGGFDRGFVVAEDGEEIAVAHELDRPLGGAPDGLFIDGADGRAAVRLAHDTGMHHAVEPHVVDENGVAENLCRQVEARAALADAFEDRRLACVRRRRSLAARSTAPASVQ